MQKVSIVVPCYNHSRYLRKRLDSILNQTFTEFECILLDDSSDDNSVEILQEYVMRDSRFILYTNKINSGSTFAQWNYGVSLSKGKYIWIAESDDYADPNFISILLSELENDSELVLAYSQSTMINSDGKVLGHWKYESELFQRAFKKNGVEFIYNYLIYTNLIPNASAVLFKRDNYIQVGQAVASLKNNGDWHLWLKLLTTGAIYYFPNSLNYFRQHSSSVTYKAKVDILSNQKFDLNITKLRKHFAKYLSNQKPQSYLMLLKKNNLLISYEWGAYGLFAKERRSYLVAMIYIVKSSFFSGFKSYYLKKLVFGNFYYRLFQKP